jgi:hypothetical protein
MANLILVKNPLRDVPVRHLRERRLGAVLGLVHEALAQPLGPVVVRVAVRLMLAPEDVRAGYEYLFRVVWC